MVQKAVQKRLLPSTVVDFIDELRTEWGLKAISVSVVQAGARDTADQSVDIQCFGTINAHGDSATSKSLWPIGSNSKMFCAISIGLLITKGVALPNGKTLEWTSRVKECLPGFQFGDNYMTNHLTLKDLLSMRSGVPRHDIAGTRHTRGLKQLALFACLPATTEMRDMFQYSNIHYNILQLVIERLSGESYASFVQENLFKPLGMSGATFELAEVSNNQQAVSGCMRMGVNGRALHTAVHQGLLNDIDADWLGQAREFGFWTEEACLDSQAAFSLVMSHDDMVKWLYELLNPRVIPKEILTTIRKGNLPASFGERPSEHTSTLIYGMGQWEYSYRGHPVVGHMGGVPGFLSWLALLPHEGYGIFVSMNDQKFGFPGCEIIGKRILDELLHHDPLDWRQHALQSWWPTPTTSVPTLRHIRKSSPLRDIEGSYLHPGYSSLELISVHDGNSSTRQNRHPQITKSALNALAIDADLKLDPVAPILVSRCDSFFASHLILYHLDGPVFGWFTIDVYPRFSPTPEVQGASVGRRGRCVLVPGSGIGMFEGWSGSGVLSELTEEDVALKAEVWYAKAETV